MHEFNKPYKCKYCTYDAVQSSTLRKHIQIRHKEYCRYHCVTCKEFYCQEENTLAAHLDKKHGSQRRKSIEAYLNPHYRDESNVVVKEYVQTRGRPRANKGVIQSPPSQINSYSKDDATPTTQYPVVKQEPGSAHFPSGLHSPPTSPSFSGQLNYKPGAAHQGFHQNSNAGTAPSYDNNDIHDGSQSFCSDNDIPSFQSPPNNNLVSPTGQSEVTDTEIMDFSSLTGEYKCNQCPFQTSEEQAFMNHLVNSHSGTAVVDPNTGIRSNSKANLQPQHVNPFQVNAATAPAPQSTDNCCEEDLPNDNDISKLQLGRDDGEEDMKPNFNSNSLSTTLSSPVQSEIAAEQPNHQNLTPSPQTSHLTMSSPSSLPKDHHHQGVALHDVSILGGSVEGNTPSSKHSYRCRHCDIIFPDNILYAIHRGAHGFHQPFQCNLCGQDCGNKYNFASHLQGCAT